MTILAALAVGLLMGVLSGFGVGGGSLLVLYLTALAGEGPLTAGGINLLYFFGCAPTALWFHARGRRVDWRAAIWAAAGGVGTAAICVWIATQADMTLLRRLFGVLLLGIGVRELRLCVRQRRS